MERLNSSIAVNILDYKTRKIYEKDKDFDVEILIVTKKFKNKIIFL